MQIQSPGIAGKPAIYLGQHGGTCSVIKVFCRGSFSHLRAYEGATYISIWVGVVSGSCPTRVTEAQSSQGECQAHFSFKTPILKPHTLSCLPPATHTFYISIWTQRSSEQTGFWIQVPIYSHYHLLHNNYEGQCFVRNYVRTDIFFTNRSPQSEVSKCNVQNKFRRTQMD